MNLFQIVSKFCILGQTFMLNFQTFMLNFQKVLELSRIAEQNGGQYANLFPWLDMRKIR